VRHINLNPGVVKEQKFAELHGDLNHSLFGLSFVKLHYFFVLSIVTADGNLSRLKGDTWRLCMYQRPPELHFEQVAVWALFFYIPFHLYYAGGLFAYHPIVMGILIVLELALFGLVLSDMVKWYAHYTKKPKEELQDSNTP
jgi:hypothetical protein